MIYAGKNLNNFSVGKFINNCYYYLFFKDDGQANKQSFGKNQLKL